MPGTQARFADALLDPARAPPPGLRAAGDDLPRRFAVHRNNVVVSLIDALAERYPVTQALVGEDFFRAMARVHVRATPPASPVMLLYGEAFPGFIEAFPPAASVPYLADIARLEAACTRAFHAADEASVAAAAFAALDPGALAALRLRIHGSAQVIRSRFAVHSIWHAHQASAELSAIDAFAPEDALVVRPQYEVRVLRLRPGEAGFLQALIAGETLGEAAAAAGREATDFDLAGALTSLIGNGIAAGLIAGARA